MKTTQFKLLDEAEKVDLVNKRLQELRAAGHVLKEFSNEELQMSYSFVARHLREHGYMFEKETYMFVKATEEQQENMKTPPRLELSKEEIVFLKQMFTEYRQTEIKSFEYLVRQNAGQAFKATSIKLRERVAADWSDFSKAWSYYNSSDLITAALVHFMKTFPPSKTNTTQSKLTPPKK